MGLTLALLPPSEGHVPERSARSLPQNNPQKKKEDTAGGPAPNRTRRPRSPLRGKPGPRSAGGRAGEGRGAGDRRPAGSQQTGGRGSNASGRFTSPLLVPLKPHDHIADLTHAMFGATGLRKLWKVLGGRRRSRGYLPSDNLRTQMPPRTQSPRPGDNPVCSTAGAQGFQALTWTSFLSP